MRWLSWIAESSIWTREFRLDFKPILRFVHERPEAVILGIGVLLRVVVYLSNRSMWLDELSLSGNIVGKPVLDFSEYLASDQLAPFGFLIVQRALVPILGDSNFALRLVPLIAGVLSLYLFSLLARRVLPRRAALVALVLFAFSDDLIYYSSEMKPYSVDLAVGLAISLAAFDALGRSASSRSFVMAGRRRRHRALVVVLVRIRRGGMRRGVDPGQLALEAISHGFDLGDFRPGLARDLLRVVRVLARPAQP